MQTCMTLLVLFLCMPRMMQCEVVLDKVLLATHCLKIVCGCVMHLITLNCAMSIRYVGWCTTTDVLSLSSSAYMKQKQTHCGACYKFRYR